MVIDCFTFFNELDLLELRLHELAPVVDRFVLIESPVTHAGNSKPLYFAENRQRFQEFLPRIRHVVPELSSSDAVSREREQRAALQSALTDCRGDDWVLFSDADEIVSAAALQAFCSRNRTAPANFRQHFSYYFVNSRGGAWNGSCILTAAAFRERPDPTYWRYLPGGHVQTIDEGGWHFSYLGGVEAIQAKLRSFSHHELDRRPYNDPGFIRTMMAIGGDLFLRHDDCFQSHPLDQSYPRFLRDQQERFTHLIHPGGFHETWYGVNQLALLMRTLAKTVGRVDWREDARNLDGDIVELGCWEGRSTIALANIAAPAEVIAVDTWQGSSDEHPEHPTVHSARERDVFTTFCRNVQNFTEGNVNPLRCDVHEFLAGYTGRMRFVHVDASHDYSSVRRTLERVLPHVVEGGIVCGDDLLTASLERADLDGGVERAVRECLPGFSSVGNIWWWEKPADSHH